MTSTERAAAASTLLVGELALGFAAAGCVALCVVWSTSGTPLPAYGWAAAFLFLVVEEDVRHMRIPNWLTFPCLGLAVAWAVFDGGIAGLGHSLLGAAVAFAVLFLPFAARWLGAGDVKAVMVLGALWGAGVVLGLIGWMILVGGALGIGLLAARGGLGDWLRRWLRTLHLLVATRRLAYAAPEPGSAAAGGLPFGIAVGLSVAAYQWWGTPWL